jgi:hypothetical protein
MSGFSPCGTVLKQNQDPFRNLFSPAATRRMKEGF